ncbi:MAG: YjjW family glycine radical enzyme activase [Gammaproteobacteria bacterium]|nr:YjjW family glycine radical enzyme activase [Gammaproteobacteria bacterium]
MSSTRATVSKILTYSIVDGPGNRLVIFLQGCNFVCAACHNPHTIGACDHCGECIPACHVDALSLVDGRIAYDPTACDHCDECLDVCPISANPMVREYSVAEILELAREHRPFLTGVTVSGGEPTKQLDFVIELFRAIKSDNELAELSCFIDSNGHLDASGWQNVLPVTDGVMLDIKAFDNPTHQSLTGMQNVKSLESARVLHAAGKLYELRFLLVPGKTDSDAELDSLIGFVKELGTDTRVRLNAFQHHGVKGEALGWEKMSEAGVDKVAERLRAAGIDNVATPAVYL